LKEPDHAFLNQIFRISPDERIAPCEVTHISGITPKQDFCGKLIARVKRCNQFLIRSMLINRHRIPNQL